MKAGWRVLPLGEVCDVLDSKRKPITKRDRQPGPYPYFGATGELDRVAGYIFDEPLVLLGEDGAKWGAGDNSAFRVADKVWVNNHAHVIRPIRTLLDDDWLVYYLNFSDLAEFITGLTVPKLNQGRMRDIPIPLPPLDEQKRIVAVLDEALEGVSRARTNAEANLTDARELFDSALRGVFHGVEQTAPKHTLAAVARAFGRGKSRHRPRNDPKLYGGNFPFVQTGDIRNSDGYVTTFSQTYNELGLAQSKLWPDGTVCITIAANIAETAILGFPACFPDSIIGMVCDPEKVRPEYIELMLRYFSADLKEKGKGSAQDNINLATFEQSPFPVPRIADQVRIVEQLSEIAQLRRNLEAQFLERIVSLNTLGQSLFQRAFSGELT